MSKDRILVVLALLLIAVSVIAGYSDYQNDRLSERHMVASNRIAALELEAKLVRKGIAARSDTIFRLQSEAELIRGRLEFYRRRSRELVDLINRPPAPYDGSDSTLARAMDDAYRHGRGSPVND